MTQIHDQTERGIGNVWHNGQLLAEDVRYTLSHSHEQLAAGTFGTPAAAERGLGRIVGQLHGTLPFSVIDVTGQPIELELEDGRRWHCLMKSSDGDLLNCGGITGGPQQ